MTMKGGHEWWKYVYDEYYDCVICPEYQVLKIEQQTVMGIENTRAILKFAKIVRRESYAQNQKIA